MVEEESGRSEERVAVMSEEIIAMLKSHCRALEAKVASQADELATLRRENIRLRGDLWTLRDIRDLTGFTSNTINGWRRCERGFPKPVKTGRWRPEDVLSWWRENEGLARNGWRS